MATQRNYLEKGGGSNLHILKKTYAYHKALPSKNITNLPNTVTPVYNDQLGGQSLCDHYREMVVIRKACVQWPKLLIVIFAPCIKEALFFT